MPKSNPDKIDKENSGSTRVESLTIQEDVKENEVEDEEGLVIYPYERLKITATDPVPSIDVTKREVCGIIWLYNLFSTCFSSFCCLLPFFIVAI